MLQFRTTRLWQQQVTRLIGQRRGSRTGPHFLREWAGVGCPRRGAALAEYVLLVGLIAIIAMAAVMAFGFSLLGLWTDLSSKLPSF